MENYTKVFRRIFYLFTISWSLVACGRERATPTPIPANVVRPVQPTPAYARSSAFRLTPPPSVATGEPIAPSTPTNRLPLQTPILTPASDAATLLLAQTPTALAVVTVDATLVDNPNGKAMAQLPTGAVLTITGKTADGRYLAAYTNAGATGWINAGQVMLFGADNLVVVAESRGPGVAATLVAAAMQPVHVLDVLLTITPAPTPNQ